MQNLNAKRISYIMAPTKKIPLLNTVIPISPDILQESIRLIGDKNTRMENLAICISQDLALAIEIIRNANATFFAGGKATISSVKLAITRLGSDTITSILSGLKSRKEPEDEKVLGFLNIYRDKSKRASIIARMFAETLNKNIQEECLLSGLFLYLGNIIALLHLEEEFVELAENNSPVSLKFKLSKDFKIDTDEATINYLKKLGMPDTLVIGLDRNEQIRNDINRSTLKSIVWSAFEFIEYFDSGKWGKLAPGQTLPAKSPIRALPLTEHQYKKIYERSAGYFISNQLLNMNKQKFTFEGDFFDEDETESGLYQDGSKTIIDFSFEDELNQLLGAERKDKFKLKQAQDEPKEARKDFSELTITTPVDTYSEESNKLLRKTEIVLDKIETSEEAVTTVLDILIDKGPFEKACIIVVSDDKEDALVVCARGPVENGQKLAITDLLSPLSQQFTNIQSFGNKASSQSPYKSKSFAIAPIDVNHSTPVSLYADCGEKSLTFEARRIFRNVVSILNQRLPALKGGVPIEISLDEA